MLHDMMRTTMGMTQESPDAPTRRKSLPEFELTYAVDNDEEPGLITVYPKGNPGTTTEWISIDAGSAIDLDSVR